MENFVCSLYLLIQSSTLKKCIEHCLTALATLLHVILIIIIKIIIPRFFCFCFCFFVVVVVVVFVLFFCFSVCLFAFFCANHCVIVTTNFSRCCGRLRFAAHYFLLWASRRLYCHNNNNKTISNIYNFKLYIELFTK